MDGEANRSNPNPRSIDDAAVAVLAKLRRSVVAIVGEGGSGSGTVLTDDRTVVTNHHVVRGDRATVVDADGRRRNGRLVAREPDADLAVLRVDEAGLEPAELAPAQALKPGTGVFAIGNPLGQEGAVAAGIVLAAPLAGELIRANIRLWPGNSGGPLADGLGRVVGINAMVAGRMGLAVPSEAVTTLLTQVGGDAEVLEPGYLGIAGHVLAGAIAAGLPERASSGAWLLTAVEPGSPAAAAGLWPGDILLDLDGNAPGDDPSRWLRAGRRTRARLLRGDAVRELELVPRSRVHA